VSIYLIVILLLRFIFNTTNLTTTIIIGSGATALRSPKYEINKKQSCKELLSKWRLSKKGDLYKSKL
jgi:hypothetical protein